MRPRRLPRGPARALLLIDEPILAGVVELTLNHGKYITRVASEVGEAIDALNKWQPHFAVVDVDLNSRDVMDWVEQTGALAEELPIVALTRRGDLKTKLAVFEHGVDDVLTVPFSPEELVARTIALMRRSYGKTGPFAPALRIGELEIDILNRSVRQGGHELHLTSLEQNLLYLLAAHVGRVLTRDEIIDHLWGTDYAAESNVVDRHIRNLRAKLQNDSRRPRYISTVPGRGYRFLPYAEPGPAGRVRASR